MSLAWSANSLPATQIRVKKFGCAHLLKATWIASTVKTAHQPVTLKHHHGRMIQITQPVKKKLGVKVAVHHGRAQALMRKPTPLLLVPVTQRLGMVGSVPLMVGIQKISTVFTPQAKSALMPPLVKSNGSTSTHQTMPGTSPVTTNSCCL